MKKIDTFNMIGYIRGIIANCYIHDYSIIDTQDFVFHSIRLKYGIYDDSLLDSIKVFVHYTYRMTRLQTQIEKKCKHLKIKKGVKHEK